MAEYTPNANLYKWNKVDNKLQTITEMASNADKIDSSLKDLGFNLAWNALLVVNGDWTAALQNALDNHTNVIIPSKIRIDGQVTVSKFGAILQSNQQLYGSAEIEYRGVLNPIKVLGSANYVYFKNIHLKGIPDVSTDYYNTGTIGIDVTDGYTSIHLDKCWIEGFQFLVKSNYNNFYNKFTDCRFEKAKECLSNFSLNNLEVKGCRFGKFYDAIVCNGQNGGLIVEKNSFETFNGAIVKTTGVEQGLVVFKDNYVEIYDSVDLPTNFPNQTANGALPGKFGGNILFTGYYGTLKILNNELQLGGVFRVTSLAACDHFESTGNNLHLFSTGNNLDRLYGLPILKSYQMNDRLGKDIGAGPYSRTYSPVAIAVTNPYNMNVYYDPIQNKEILASQRIYTPTLTNGWSAPDATHGVPRAFLNKEGLYLQGLLTGTGNTGIIAFTIPAANRPLSYGTARAYCNLTAFSNYGAGSAVRFRYIYSSGEFRLEGTPSDLANISLDGLVIPMQI